MPNINNFMDDDYRFRSNFIKIQNNDFHYIDEGSGDPVLLIHGAMTWSFYYRHLITALAGQGNRVLAPDLMGYGFSEHSPGFDYNIQNQVNVLTEFVERLDLQNVTLVFHGMAMIPGLGVAVNLSSRFKRIISLNGIAFTTPTFLSLRLLKHVPVLSHLLITSSNLLLKTFFSRFRKSITKQSQKNYLYPNCSYDSRIAAHAFFKDAPFLHRSAVHGLVGNILENINCLSNAEWFFINANLIAFTSPRELRRAKKNFQWSTFKAFPTESHFMLENIDSPVIKYIREIVK